MPLYEYQCESCGARFERIQKFSDSPVTECPTCGGPVRKLLSSPAIQFKGSGFYITDYVKSGSSENGSGKSSGSSSKSGGEKSTASDTAASSESKPASEPAAKPVTAASE